MSREAGNGAAAVHRWFAGGENWALHPWFAGRERDLYAALAPHLLAAADRPFVVPALGGVLVGERTPDPDCPDWQARSRHPFVLRAAFLSTEPDDTRQNDVLRKLRALPLPDRPGSDPALSIDIAATPSRRADDRAADRPKVPVTSPIHGWFLVAIVSVGVLTLAGVLIAVALSGCGGTPVTTPTTQPNRTSTTSSESTDPGPGPTAPAEDLGEYLGVRTRPRFLAELGDARKIDHPYCAYLRETADRLPAAANRIADLAKKLGLGSDESRSDIDRELSYDAWRRRVRGRTFRDAAKPLPQPLRGFVERFRTPELDLLEAAGEMAGLLRHWGETDVPPAGRQPFPTIDRFFAVLTRPAGVPRPVEVDHPMIAFAWRFPADPVADGQTFDSADDLASALRRLLAHLDPEFNPLSGRESARDLVRRIGDEVRYPDWEKAHRSQSYRHADADPGEKVRSFVRRFER